MSVSTTLLQRRFGKIRGHRKGIIVKIFTRPDIPLRQDTIPKMSFAFEYYLVAAAILLVLSVIASKFSDRFGIPILIVFLGIGMLAGADGPGGIYFDDPTITQWVGMVALAIILFSGGLDTDWNSVRPVMKESVILATAGVLITAMITAVLTHVALQATWLESLLLGAIVSSTDAAAVFAILRSRGISLKGNLKPALELESGSNDPMAFFLTIGFIQLMTIPNTGLVDIVLLFFRQMIFGGVLGYVAAMVSLFLINRLRLGYEGLYPALAFGMVFLTFGLANITGGSGFLAVYIFGLLLGRSTFLHKKSLLRFYDGMAWMMQIIMFLTLGLLVFPSELPAIAGPGALIALGLILFSRPISVAICLIGSQFTWRERAFIAWVGLRGAVPIILATYPLVMGIPAAGTIFNIVFFVVLASVLIQGTTIPHAARWLKVDAALPVKRDYPIEFIPGKNIRSELMEIEIPPGAKAAGLAIYQLNLPDDYLVVLVARGEEFLVPNGGLVLQPGDALLSLSSPEAYEQAKAILTA